MSASPMPQLPPTRSKVVLPRRFLGFPWFAWVALAIYAVILFSLFSAYL